MKTNEAEMKELRLAKGWTQELLAQQAGVTPRTIQRAENGNASIASLRAIARALGVQVGELLLRSSTQQTRPNQPKEEPDGSDYAFPDRDVEEFILYLLEQEEQRRATNPHQKDNPVWFENTQIKEDLGWGVGRINDAVELAEQLGWVFLSDEISGSHFNFRQGYLTGAGKIFADPARREDPTRLLYFLASQGEGEERGYKKLSVPEIAEGLSWDFMRTEESIKILVDEEKVDARVSLGWPSYSRVSPTASGRREAARRKAT